MTRNSHIISARLFCAAMAVLLTATLASAQQGKTYRDGARGEIYLPLGDLSFADEVVSRTVGSGRIVPSAEAPEAALGVPNFSGNVDDGSFLSLGCDGDVVLRFVDNALVDLKGPDLYVFEVGPNVEGMNLAISADGAEWIEVGEISGGRSEVDISEVATEGANYGFVRLTDDGAGCGSRFAGADIDAVAAIGSAQRFTLDASVLFAVDSAVLRDEANAALDALAADIAGAGIRSFTVTGHTDDTGSAEHNADLSLRRAEAVKTYLNARPELSEAQIQVAGRGETEPVASNETKTGRQMNRRVEIIAQSGTQ